MGQTALTRIALVGNPNSGKTTLFNRLTGLRQKVGNYAGVTVDRKATTFSLADQRYQLIDLPGTYSLHPKSLDESVVLETLIDKHNESHPDLILYIADATQLDKQFLLLSQILDLGIPTALLLNMSDLVHLSHDVLQKVQAFFGCPVFSISGHSSSAKSVIEQAIQALEKTEKRGQKRYRQLLSLEEERELQGLMGMRLSYRNELMLMHHGSLRCIDDGLRTQLANFTVERNLKPVRLQIDDVMNRYREIDPVVLEINKSLKERHGWTDRIDAVVSHVIIGPLLFFAILILLFNAVFSFAQWPMDQIDLLFAQMQGLVGQFIPEGMLRSFVADGLVAGLGGVLIFIPQIAILFLFIGILESIGYMSRAVYLFDGTMRRFGLNGRSVVSLVSSGACAIPAIMSARTISNWKERLITILVSPFVSCSARLPVYIILISLAIPQRSVWGIFNLQGLTMTGLYFVSVIAALVSAWALNKIFKMGHRSSLMMELPDYKWPNVKDVLLDTYFKVKSFVVEAGKIILVISMLLWLLASFGPGKSMARAEREAMAYAQTHQLSEEERDQLVSSQMLEVSYIGRLGQFIEPAIEPLGYDWKIGIALLTSFAAREVFVGTMATIYSVGEEDEKGLLDKLRSAQRPNGMPVFTFATCISLMLFYLFAMQCMSTLAVVQKETGSWKWPILQFVMMSGLAYFSSLIAYQLLA